MEKGEAKILPFHRKEEEPKAMPNDPDYGHVYIVWEHDRLNESDDIVAVFTREAYAKKFVDERDSKYGMSYSWERHQVNWYEHNR